MQQTEHKTLWDRTVEQTIRVGESILAPIERWIGKRSLVGDATFFEPERFLQEFVGAGLSGEIRQLWIAGPPWALTMAARFDDEASAGGERLYANRVAMVIRTRWGRIVEQQDFYEDSERIPAFERALREHGIAPVTA